MLLEFRIRFMNLMFEMSIVTGCFERESLKKKHDFLFFDTKFQGRAAKVARQRNFDATYSLFFKGEYAT